MVAASLFTKAQRKHLGTATADDERSAVAPTGQNTLHAIAYSMESDISVQVAF